VGLETMILDMPSHDIAEITLIGTGGGYGESILVHLGHKNWIAIDSCIDPKTKDSLPLDYLRKIGVDIKTDIKMIICTHWHDDHILGLSQLLEEATTATFCMAKPNDLRKFLSLVNLDYRKIDIEVSNSSTIEFNKCLEIINIRNRINKNAEADKTLLNINIGNGLTSSVISLSPSEATIKAFDSEISTLITNYGESSKKIINKTPNSKSVVLFIKLATHRAILGSDLEVTESNTEGWLNIIEHSQVIDKKSSLFKIPHHGSSNGYHERIWLQLLEEYPVSKLTPWNKSKKLPEPKMLEKYLTHTDKLFMTTAILNDKPKERSRTIDKIIKKMNFKIKEVKYNKGIIRCRINLLKPEEKWQVDLFENALHVNKTVNN
jgi:beta-lactamase superfamily II metal-dependent hydrolase